MDELEADLKRLRRVVGAELASARAVATDLAGELDRVVASAADAPPDDEHDSEGSTVGFERARIGALLDHTRRRVAELEDAAERVDQGDYGGCDGCGRPIDPLRLAALPSTRYCIDCAPASRAASVDLSPRRG